MEKIKQDDKGKLRVSFDLDEVLFVSPQTHKTEPELIRKEIVQTVEACLRCGCPFELVLKDISTVSNRPANLIQWQETVGEVLDEYFG